VFDFLLCDNVMVLGSGNGLKMLRCWRRNGDGLLRQKGFEWKKEARVTLIVTFIDSWMSRQDREEGKESDWLAGWLASLDLLRRKQVAGWQDRRKQQSNSKEESRFCLF